MDQRYDNGNHLRRDPYDQGSSRRAQSAGEYGRDNSRYLHESRAERIRREERASRQSATRQVVDASNEMFPYPSARLQQTQNRDQQDPRVPDRRLAEMRQEQRQAAARPGGRTAVRSYVRGEGQGADAQRPARSSRYAQQPQRGGQAGAQAPRAARQSQVAGRQNAGGGRAAGNAGGRSRNAAGQGGYPYQADAGNRPHRQGAGAAANRRGTAPQAGRQTGRQANPRDDREGMGLTLPKVTFREKYGAILGTIAKKAGLIVGAIAVVAVGIGLFAHFRTVDIQLNGQELAVRNTRDLDAAYAAAVEQQQLKVVPGDFIAVDGSVITQGGGTPYTALVNGTIVKDGTWKLSKGDDIVMNDGTDIMEEFTAEESAIPYKVTQAGVGPLHKNDVKGADGVMETRTGATSGLTAKKTLVKATNPVCQKYYPETGNDKVICLTFDDGPYTKYTPQILDILKENDAKATFFVIGEQCEGKAADLIKREAEEGHQICTHSWDHAEGSGQGVNLGYMSKKEQIAEIQKGMDAISKITGQDCSTVIRTPGGNYSEETATYLEPLVSAEIGWSIDTTDWARPGTDAIYKQMMDAWPGAIILCHDGGGDRSQTVAALKKALPKLKAKGYRFITVDEMLKYPASTTS